MHCLEKFECPQGIDFPTILGNHSRYTIAKALGQDASAYVENYNKMEGLKADACVGCGGCTEWCEYHLDIPAMMQKAHEDLGR
jgi:predicted aldo/keto reductase-like oxidoreductase